MLDGCLNNVYTYKKLLSKTFSNTLYMFSTIPRNITKFSALRHFHNIFKRKVQKHFKNEQNSKSPWKTTDGKGAKTFPFHNLPPLVRKHLEKVFFYSFQPFLCWIKEKTMANLAYRNICKQKMQKTVYKQSVLPP